jgi:hypothetical protein
LWLAQTRIVDWVSAQRPFPWADGEFEPTMVRKALPLPSGESGVKTEPSFLLVSAAVEAAADYDSYVCVLADNDESVIRCIRAGIKDIVHGHLLREEVVKLMAENDVWLGSLSSPILLRDP